MSLQSYDVCGHCNQILSEKALKEHRRLYYDERSRVWITVDKSAVSPASSPFCLSPPGSTAASDNHSEVDSQLQDIMLSQSSCGHSFEENLMDQENLMSSKLISPPFDSAITCIILKFYVLLIIIIMDMQVMLNTGMRMTWTLSTIFWWIVIVSPQHLFLISHPKMRV